MTNILILEGGTGHGGSSSYLYGFLKYLDRQRFNPILVFYNYADGPNIEKIEKLGLPIFFLTKKKSVKITGAFQQKKAPRILKIPLLLLKLLKNNLNLIAKVVTIIRKNRIRIVFLNAEVHFHIPGVIAAKITRTPCVVRKSGVGTDLSHRIRSFLSRYVELFISSCPAETKFHKENGWPSKRMVTIYEGVDVKDYKPLPNSFKIHREFGIGSDVFLIGYISRLESGKGHDDFLKAAQAVIKKIPNSYFLIVGADVDSNDNTMGRQLQTLAKSLRISQNVIFAGWRTDVKDILQDIDVFVHCPNAWREGMGIATLEAIACGKPVVITDNWGLAETAKDGYNGFVVPIGEYEKISQSIIALLENGGLRKTMGDNSRVYAELNFNIAKNVKKIEVELLGLLNQHG